MSTSGPVKVPWRNGMALGRGFNSYTQTLLGKDAVTVPGTERERDGLQKSYQSREITRFEQIAQSLNVSAGFGITVGRRNGGGIEAEFNNRSDFESSHFTFQVAVDVEWQPSPRSTPSFNPLPGDDWRTKDPDLLRNFYGDRYISNFIRGGSFTGRISITTRDGFSKSSVEANADMAMRMFVARATIDAEFRAASEQLQRESDVDIVMREYTGASNIDGTAHFTEFTTNSLVDLQERGLAFYEDDSKHVFIRFAILERYEVLPDFLGWDNMLSFSPADISRGWELFDDYTWFQEFVPYLVTLNLRWASDASRDHFGREVQQILNLIIDETEDISNGKKVVPSHKSPRTFQREIMNALRPQLEFVWTGRNPSLQIDLHTLTSASSPPNGWIAMQKDFSFLAWEDRGLVGMTRITTFRGQILSEQSVIQFDNGALPPPTTNTTEWVRTSDFWVFTRPDQEKLPNVSPLAPFGITVSVDPNMQHRQFFNQGEAIIPPTSWGMGDGRNLEYKSVRVLGN